MKKPSILVVEDDADIQQLVSYNLVKAGFNVTCADTGEEALQKLSMEPVDAIVLDLMLPGKDGLTVCRELREFHTGPIILLTSLNSDMNQILGFEIGANDYVVKTTPPSVLLARIRAQLRHGQATSVQPVVKTADKSTLNFGKLVVDSRNRTANYMGESLQLSTGDFDLLWELASHAGEILSRDHLLRKLRGIDYDGLDRSMDVAISRLRKKLGDDPDDPRKIKTIRHRGYLFATDIWWQE